MSNITKFLHIGKSKIERDFNNWELAFKEVYPGLFFERFPGRMCGMFNYSVQFRLKLQIPDKSNQVFLVGFQEVHYS